MAVYLITYDLRKPGKNYDGLFKRIESYPDHKKLLLSVYAVNTLQNSDQIFNYLSPELDANDSILVIRITRDYQGWLPKHCWDWLDSRL